MKGMNMSKKVDADRMVDADKMAYMWEKYVNWKKFWCDDKTFTMEDFARYMRNFHQYDLLG